jgi:hypothetical protein
MGGQTRDRGIKPAWSEQSAHGFIKPPQEIRETVMTRCHALHERENLLLPSKEAAIMRSIVPVH